jgi:hypothetical protein
MLDGEVMTEKLVEQVQIAHTEGHQLSRCGRSPRQRAAESEAGTAHAERGSYYQLGASVSPSSWCGCRHIPRRPTGRQCCLGHGGISDDEVTQVEAGVLHC